MGMAITARTTSVLMSFDLPLAAVRGGELRSTVRAVDHRRPSTRRRKSTTTDGRYMVFEAHLEAYLERWSMELFTGTSWEEFLDEIAESAD